MTLTAGLSERVAERADQRRRARRRHRLRLLATVAVVLALVIGAGWVVLGSSLLGVRTVHVVGVHRLPADAVRQAAAVPAGTPLARLDAAAVARRVRQLPPVRHVEVDRDWPGAVVLRVHERTAVAARPLSMGWALVDRAGVSFATVSSRPRRLPRVSAAGDGPAALRRPLTALRALPVAVRSQVKHVGAPSPERITLHLTRGRTVVWGSTERSGRKAAVLAVLLSRRAAVYDVSAPDTPTTRR